MLKKFLIMVVFTAVLAGLAGCGIDLSNQNNPATTPTSAPIPEQPTPTSEVIPPTSSLPSKEPEPTSPARATPSQPSAATPTVDINDIKIDVAPVAGSLANPVYIVQAGTPAKLENFLQPAAGCNWTGVAGQVFDPNQMPVTGLVVEVGGKLEGSDLLRLTLTGGSQTMGPGGYEIPLSDHVIASKQEIYIQLFDINGIPLSDQIYFDTYASCQENLVVINFVATSLYSNFLFFPFVNTGR